MTDARDRKILTRAPEYIAATFDPSDRLAILVRNAGRGETIQRIAPVERILDPSFQDWLRFKNDNEGFDVYVGMNPLKPQARTRTKEDVLSIRHLYVDLDRDGPASLKAIQQSNLIPMPNCTLATSPDRFQVVWRVEDVTQEHAESLLRAMARKFNGDLAATDSTRVLRLPGFANKKYDEDFPVRAEQHSDRVNHAADFRFRIEYSDASYQPARHTASPRNSADRPPLSQSERDWAFAKRALARGDDPEALIQQIAQFRQEDKHKPLDYARRTVTKAAAELEREQGQSRSVDGSQPPHSQKGLEY